MDDRPFESEEAAATGAPAGATAFPIRVYVVCDHCKKRRYQLDVSKEDVDALRRRPPRGMDTSGWSDFAFARAHAQDLAPAMKCHPQAGTFILAEGEPVEEA